MVGWSRSPHGERGLKCKLAAERPTLRFGSLSSRRAWIEILLYLYYTPIGCVALLTESVDWNISISNRRRNSQKSLSSRRAWIEIISAVRYIVIQWCRSPHGERGLKLIFISYIINYTMSLSSRRAWIEIKLRFSIIISVASVALLTESVDWNRTILFGDYGQKVALLTESVDWNIVKVNYNSAVLGRSPHGERGLK